MKIMKHSLVIFILLLLNSNLYSQNKKETVYLLFDINSKERCKIEVEFSSDNDGELDGYQTVKKYRKRNSSYNSDCIVFDIGDEEFVTNIKKDCRDTCSIDKLNQLKLVDIEYMVEKWRNPPREFKHHVFEKIFMVEKISKHKIIIIITDVMWTDEIFVVD
jgi:hypothetical protein